jgi:hypothetical protein
MDTAARARRRGTPTLAPTIASFPDDDNSPDVEFKTCADSVASAELIDDCAVAVTVVVAAEVRESTLPTVTLKESPTLQAPVDVG